MQKQAYEDLETAFNGELTPEQLEEKFQLNQKMGSSKGFKGTRR